MIRGLFFTFVLGFCLLVGLIRTSQVWIPWFLALPSRAKAVSSFRFPPHLNVEFPAGGEEVLPLKKAYIMTDARGALIHPDQIDAKTLVFGSTRISNIFTRPEHRWTSMIKVPNFNFGYPNVSFEAGLSSLRKIVHTFDGQIDRVVIGDWSLGREQLLNYPDSFLNLNRLYIWNTPILEHPLYELIFLSLVKWSENPAVQITIPSDPSKKEDAFKSSKESAEWINKKTKSYLNAVTALKSEFARRNIELILLLGPNPDYLSLHRKEANELIRMEAPRLDIKLIDIDACFKKNLYDSSLVFIRTDYLTIEGNRLFAKCFDAYFN